MKANILLKKILSPIEWESTLLELQEATLAANQDYPTPAASKRVRVAEQKLTDHFVATNKLIELCSVKLREYALKNGEPDPFMWE